MNQGILDLTQTAVVVIIIAAAVGRVAMAYKGRWKSLRENNGVNTKLELLLILMLMIITIKMKEQRTKVIQHQTLTLWILHHTASF